jgi:enamine deaminase RidA (YjgF/YER057c/UK114 family)
MIEMLKPQDWSVPRGFVHGLAARGRLVFTAGQIGRDEVSGTLSERLADQVRQALRNVVAVIAEAGGGPEHVVRLTWYITHKTEYSACLREIGEAYREVMGYHYPAMSVLVVSALIEDGARVEIEGTAVIPE